jgi:transcriptional regulator with XRE-family HTH domain
VIELASLLVLERERRGLSLRAAAKALGFSNPYLSQLETGKAANPTLDVIQRLTKVYRIKPEVWMRVRTIPGSITL